MFISEIYLLFFFPRLFR